MANKKSFLVIGINFFPEPTGIGKYTGQFAFHLAQLGHQVKVITSFPYYPHWKLFSGYHNLWYKKEIINQVSVTRCPLYIPSSLNGLKRMLQDFSFCFTAAIYLVAKMMFNRQRYEYVFVASPSFTSGFLGILYTKIFRNSKLVYHIQDLQIDAAEELKIIKNKNLLNILKSTEGQILKNAHLVSTISVGMQNRIRVKNKAIQREYLFPNWVDFQTIFYKIADTDKLKPLGIPLYKKLVFYSGAVGEKQGLEIVLSVAKKCEIDLQDLVFVISGSGPYFKVLQQKAKDLNIPNLYFIPLQPIDVFNELLNHSFVHLIIQKDTASDLMLPSKLTNILAVGGLCIVTATNGTSLYEIITQNMMGMVIAPEDEAALFQALYHIKDNLNDIAVLKKNAQNFAIKNLKSEIIIDDFLNELKFL